MTVKSWASNQLCNYVDEVQGGLPQNVPLWREEYFELKIIEAQEMQGELYTTPLIA